MNAVMRELPVLAGDRDAIVETAMFCEACLELEALYVARGQFEEAAVFAERAEAESEYAFWIATW